MNRRHFLHQAAASTAALALAGCAPGKKNLAATPPPPRLPFYDAVQPINPIRAHEDRLFRITVCLRPFRAMGPRMDTEQIAGKLVVHNYGHGGSGWSLSWGSGKFAVEKALSNGDRDIAIIGCGALGLTSAILAQRAGARVTIYAKERPPEVRSARATGSWTPDSRIALVKDAPPTFAAQWEKMARASWSMYQSYLGMPGNPIEYTDRYMLSDKNSPPPSPRPAGTEDLEFARYEHLIGDLTPKFQTLPPGSYPFPVDECRRTTSLQFNVADYSRQLLNDFYIAGGKIETMEFHEPSEFVKIPQKSIIHCTGYGAKALFNDASITPVRGQIGWLIPQPEVNYGFYYRQVNVLARRDGIVVQSSEQGEASGWNDANETPDRGEAERAVRVIADLYSRMQPKHMS
jgi:glycine/D-amino acid oxidase-like deaminating enzyme